MSVMQMDDTVEVINSGELREMRDQISRLRVLLERTEKHLEGHWITEHRMLLLKDIRSALAGGRSDE